MGWCGLDWSGSGYVPVEGSAPAPTRKVQSLVTFSSLTFEPVSSSSGYDQSSHRLGLGLDLRALSVGLIAGMRPQGGDLSVTVDVQLLFWLSGYTQPSCDWQQLRYSADNNLSSSRDQAPLLSVERSSPLFLSCTL
jgi:hypothetical protein